MTTHLKLQFEVDPRTPAESIMTAIRQELQGADDVSAVFTSIDKTRFTGLEILAAITFGAQFVHQAHAIVHDASGIVDDAGSITVKLKQFFTHVVNTMRKTQGIHDVSIDIGMKSIPVSQLSDANLTRIADAVLARMKNSTENT